MFSSTVHTNKRIMYTLWQRNVVFAAVVAVDVHLDHHTIMYVLHTYAYIQMGRWEGIKVYEKCYVQYMYSMLMTMRNEIKLAFWSGQLSVY